MTMTDLNGKIEDTIITLNKIAPRRSFSDDERFLSDLITSYRELQARELPIYHMDTDGSVEVVGCNRCKINKAANKELLEAIGDYLHRRVTYTMRLATAIDKLQALYTEHSTDTEGVCETTSTERFVNLNCKCDTYPDNLGPCKDFEVGANGRCVYCDHNLECHHSTDTEGGE